MTVKHRLGKIIRRSVDGNAWHGPSVKESIAGLTPQQAASKPIDSAHSIWELTLHIASWLDETAERINGGFHPESLMGNFPAPGELTDESWQRANATLDQALRKLLDALQQFPEERLMDRVRTTEGPSITFFDMLAGIAEHNTYHAGQIMLLRKMI